MKLYRTLGLATAGIAWLATFATAQRVTTNPTAVPNTVSTPTFSPDTLRPSRDQILNDNTAGQDDADRKNKRDRKRAMRRNNRSDENSRMNRSGSTSTDSNSTSSSNLNRQDGAYRQGSVSSGTTSATPNLNKPAETGTGEAVSGAANAPITNPSARTRSTTLADFVASQPDYSTFQNALQSVDLVNTLKEGQAYTLFAPSNAAFKKLPAVTQNVLLEGQNKESLKKLLTYHVIQGTMDAKELAKRINAGNGTAQLKTLSGGLLTAKLGSNNRVIITDEQGNSAYVDTSDQIQTNGVIHGIDNVLMPKANSIIFK